MFKHKPTKPTFRSHLPNGSSTGQVETKFGEDGKVTFQQPVQPMYLQGELQVAKVNNVYRSAPYTDQKHGFLGTLFVTNFKISFLPSDCSSYEMDPPRNKLVGENDIVLNNINTVYQVSKGRRKKLMPGNISGNVKYLEINCKDFRMHKFSFKATDKNEARNLVNAIIHHAFPTRLKLLFAFDYSGPTAPTVPEPVEVPTFLNELDWTAELDRLKVAGFKILHNNVNFQVSKSLSEYLVVPLSANGNDAHLFSTELKQFQDDRYPFWCYTYNSRSSIVKMGYLFSETTNPQLENKVKGIVQMAHAHMNEPVTFDLFRILPSVRDLQVSYDKITELCMPASLKETWSTDRNWYSLLDGTRWLFYVGQCLQISSEVVNTIVKKEQSVILKEPQCTDMAPLISSLSQVMLDPHYRTFQGFQGLVQREWVAHGHHFASRTGLVAAAEWEQSPVFLLFLDCVWQLMQQFPSQFQYTSVYLITLWDSICMGLFQNFIFNSAFSRAAACRRIKTFSDNEFNHGPAPKFMSVWDWSLQFTDKEMSLFNNPLYIAQHELMRMIPPRKTVVANTSEDVNTAYASHVYHIYSNTNDMPGKTAVLYPVTSGAALHFWSECYMRWMSPFVIVGGGSPAEYLQQCLLVEEIILLKHQFQSLQKEEPFVKAKRPSSELIFGCGRAGEVPRNCYELSMTVTSSFPYSQLTSGTGPNRAEIPLYQLLENSFIQEYEVDTESSMEEMEDSLDQSTDQAQRVSNSNPPESSP